jgi:uncharacterized protein DUF6777
MPDTPTPPSPPSGPPPSPPSGPPPSPPSGPPPGPPSGPGGQRSDDERRRRALLVAGIIGLVVVILLAVVFISRGSDDGTDPVAAGSGEIFLEPAAEPGADPFTNSAAEPAPSSTVPLAEPVSLAPNVTAPKLDAPATTAPDGRTGTKSFAGGTPGLYGGTRDKASCDKEKMVSFLQANPAKASAWADAQGIGVDEVPAFIRGLTPVVLRGDTRVTNHGFAGGRATARQSVLEAGTAVLVDQYGEPRAKCACGNPLLPPRAVPTAPRYTGPKWPKFTPGGVTVVIKNTTIIKNITIIDITTGTPFGRPTGPNPGPDVPLPTPAKPPTAGTAPPPTDQCQGFTGSLAQTLTIDSRSSQAVSTQLFEAGTCLRLVLSGEVDLDINKGGNGGFDAVWCYEPVYCPTPKPEIFIMSGGFTIWQTFEMVAPPPLAADHRYTFVHRTETRGAVAFAFYDNLTDNRGSLTVEVYA